MSDKQRQGDTDRDSEGVEDISKRDLLKVAASAAAASAAVGATSAQAYGIDGVQDALNQTGRQRLPFRQGQRTWFANIANWYEFPTTNPEILEVWAYADKLSYAPGDTVALHVNTTADTYSFEVFRDGGTLDSVLKQEGIAGAYHDTPLEAYEPGCNWPVSTQSTIPADWKSGGYVIVLTVERDGTKIEHEAFFVLRSATPGRTAKILFLAFRRSELTGSCKRKPQEPCRSTGRLLIPNSTMSLPMATRCFRGWLVGAISIVISPSGQNKMAMKWTMRPCTTSMKTPICSNPMT